MHAWMAGWMDGWMDGWMLVFFGLGFRGSGLRGL